MRSAPHQAEQTLTARIVGRLPVDVAGRLRALVAVDDVGKDFWIALEFRICAEFAGFEDNALRSHWCDGLIPEDYCLQSDQPRIQGTAFCVASGLERWRFTLLIGSSANSPVEINWTSLLPPDDVTGWLTPHPREKTLIHTPPIPTDPSKVGATAGEPALSPA